MINRLYSNFSRTRTLSHLKKSKNHLTILLQLAKKRQDDHQKEELLEKAIQISLVKYP